MIVAVVIVGHVAVIALLAIRHERGTEMTDERMTLVFLDPLEEPTPPGPARTATRPSRPARPAIVAPPPTAPPAPRDSTAITPNVDWYAHGTDAARQAATAPTTRDFGFPKRAPAPRTKQEFGWDKTHTERVHALDGGGIGIHLSDNCELTFTPLPLAGCAFGKRKVRGDLFDEMQAPVEPGDWKDR